MRSYIAISLFAIQSHTPHTAALTTSTLSSCDSDTAGNFACTGPGDNFDCSHTTQARQCARSIPLNNNCECVYRDCVSILDTLASQSPKCSAKCHTPPTITICPDYDDMHIFCEFYATIECILTSPVCNTTKWNISPCDAKARQCASQNQSDPVKCFDTFLQCVIPAELARKF